MYCQILAINAHLVGTFISCCRLSPLHLRVSKKIKQKQKPCQKASEPLARLFPKHLIPLWFQMFAFSLQPCEHSGPQMFCSPFSVCFQDRFQTRFYFKQALAKRRGFSILKRGFACCMKANMGNTWSCTSLPLLLLHTSSSILYLCSKLNVKKHTHYKPLIYYTYLRIKIILYMCT